MGFVYRLEGSLAGFSVGGSLIIVLTCLLIKDLRRHPTFLIFMLSICDLLFSLKFLVTSLLTDS